MAFICVSISESSTSLLYLPAFARAPEGADRLLPCATLELARLLAWRMLLVSAGGIPIFMIACGKGAALEMIDRRFLREVLLQASHELFMVVACFESRSMILE